jgi:hypothetical protein
MRSISFALTTEQIRNRTKTVTRRVGWQHLKRGTILQGVVKGMGLKKGESPEKLAVIVVTKVEREPLNMMSLAEQYGDREAIKEGFPHLEGHQFVRMFAENMGVKQSDEITRIEFRYIPGGAA